MINTNQQLIKEVYKKFSGEKPEFISPLPPSGSNRHYFRMGSISKTVIAAVNPDRAENEAFMYITEQLRKAGVNVPEIYFHDLDRNIYFLEDLGDTDLFSIVSQSHSNGDNNYLKWYKKAIKSMPAIQYKAAKDFDFSICYPRYTFDRQSMHWDLNYFKYHFLKLAYTPFHEQKLEDDFQALIDFLSEAPSDFFLYRDFQSRNIMVKGDKVYFIDYQGGRRGALQYDVASLLFEAKTALSEETRNELLELYIDTFSEYSFFDAKTFMRYFSAFVLIRSLQAFGAYGYRGYFERKPFFLQSIPPAMANLKWLLTHFDLGVKLPHLTATLHQMTEQPVFQGLLMPNGKLTVSVYSFSYRKGVPEDFTGNGGGYVFDCRLLPNPGMLDQFREMTGTDQPVIEFLQEKEEVGEFLRQVEKIVTASVDNYVKRRYEHLMISFGCTGGQHRSVYCAEQIARMLKKRNDIHVMLVHREQIVKNEQDAM